MGPVRFLFSKRVLLPSLLVACSLGVPEWVAQRAICSVAIGRPEQVDESSSLVTLRGNVHPLARPRFDRGPAPISLRAQRQLLLLKRTPHQEMMLQQYLNSLQDRNSPNFHRFLTPERLGQRVQAQLRRTWPRSFHG